MFVRPGQNVATALLELWEYGAKDLARRNTPDPAGVSAPIKVADRAYAVDRLDRAATALRSALEHDDDEYRVRSNLRELWPDFVSHSPSGETKARIAAQLQAGKRLAVTSAGALATTGASLKSTRSFGAHSPSGRRD